ncbi:MAG: tetratricopeptide repeat protein [Gemmatimonadota bacterium]|nr:tetratricopeptide repeat protein [Gemmatimonadota bacterium]
MQVSFVRVVPPWWRVVRRLGWPLALCAMFSLAGLTQAHAGENEALDRAEALYRQAVAKAAEGASGQAAELFQSAIDAYKKHAPSYVGLGHIHLARGDLDAAEAMFRQALRRKKRFAPAFNGLGLVFGRRPKALRQAIDAFRNALRADKAYVEAQYNLAETYRRFGSSETLGAYRKVVKMDSGHPDALFRIGAIEEAKGEYGKAEEAYQSQISVNPHHYEARLRLGIVLKMQGRTDQAITELKPVVLNPNEHQRRAVLELADIHQRRRDFDRSQALFEAYIDSLAPEEQRLYYDLSLVSNTATDSTGRSLDELKAAAAEFWAWQDPAPASAANERLVEHYRRVAVARENHGSHKFPWDDRGEVYVRFGEPDHVSRSGDVRFETDPGVLSVKDRLIAAAGAAAAKLMKDEVRSLGQVAQSSILGRPVYPVGGIWEYWIYVNVGSGIEMTFVQPNFPGPYEFARMPLGTGRITRIWQRMNPKTVLLNQVARQPTAYRPTFATGPLDFFFYTASFRGEDNKSAMEVYYGIPTRDLAFLDGRLGRLANLVRGVAVYDGDNMLVHRSDAEMILRASGAVDTSAGVFVPEIDRVLLPPGAYRVDVQVMDRNSGRTQIYREDRILKAYPAGPLSLSEVEMGARIDVADRGRFVKGDIEVIPMASRAYRPGEPVFIYYEIYNLTRDEFGATRYRIAYQIRSLRRTNVGARILGGLGRLIGKREEGNVISIEYEHVGTRPDERAYLELDMGATVPGRQMLKITVTDENSGQTGRAAINFDIRQ